MRSLTATKCQYTWTDYTPFGDIDHDCNEATYRKSNFCKKHYEQDLQHRKLEAQWKKEKKEYELKLKVGEIVLKHQKLIMKLLIGARFSEETSTGVLKELDKLGLKE